MFLDHRIMGEEVSLVEDGVKKRQILIPDWWSEKMTKFMIELERRTQISVLAEGLRGPRRIVRHFVKGPTSNLEIRGVPKDLPRDVYSATFLELLLPHQREAYEFEDPIFPDDVSDLFRSNSQASGKCFKF